MDTLEESERGNKARQLLEHPIYQEAIKNVRDGIIDKWRSAPIRDREGMHELKLMDKLLTEVEAYIKMVMESGKMADIQLEQERKIVKLRDAGIR